MQYSKLYPAMDLSQTALIKAASMLPPARCYELFVASSQFVWARRLLQDLAAATKDNPFAPYVNLKIDDSFAEDEAHWCLVAGEQAVGSEGY